MRAIILAVALLAVAGVLVPAEVTASTHVKVFERARGGYTAVSVLDGASCWKNPCAAVGGGGSTSGTVAIAGLGDAAVRPCPDRPANVCGGVAVAGTGESYGSVAVSGDRAEANGLCLVVLDDAVCVDGVAVSALGGAQGTVAIAMYRANGTSDCHAVTADEVCTGTVAISGLGHANGTAAASGDGYANGTLAAVSGTGPAHGDQVALSGTGDSEGAIAITGTGDADGTLLAVCLDRALSWQPDPRGLCPGH